MTYDCIRFIDSYRSLSSSLDGLGKTLGKDDFGILKREVPDKWEDVLRKLAYPHNCFESINDYQKPVNKFKKEYFFSKFKDKYPGDEEIKRTKKIIKIYHIKIGQKLTQLYLESDVIL